MNDDEGSRRGPSDKDGDEESADREAILLRRKVLLVSALAGIVTAGSTEACRPFACLSPVALSPDAPPQQCLNVASPPRPDVEVTPVPCLQPMAPLDASVVADDAMAVPMPCLSEAMPPRDAEATPVACLRFAAPPRDAGARPRPCLSRIHRTPTAVSCLNVIRENKSIDEEEEET